MSLMAPVVDGKLQTSTASSESLSKSNSSTGGIVNSDTFLTLLVAEMQNQDPLEPTSNTEWVSQYATFTQVEQIGEMADSMNTLRANSLVGKEVIMKVTSESTGETSYQRGMVDYIVMENGKPLLNINGNNYSFDDLDTVASSDYFASYDFYSEFSAKINALPNLNALDKSYEKAISELYQMYTQATDEQRNYLTTYGSVAEENYKKIVQRMEDLGIDFSQYDKDKEVTLSDIYTAFEKNTSSLNAVLEKLLNQNKENAEQNTSE